MNTLATGFTVETPAWLSAEIDALPGTLPAAADRIRLANRLALRNVEEGTGGPFAAVVTEGPDARILSVGVNMVLSSGLSGLHAETVALSLAQVAAGTWDLGADGARRTLTINAQPCVMCFGAVIWSGVRAVEIAVPGHQVEAFTGFDEGPVPADWQGELRRRGIEVSTGLLLEESLDVFRAYRRRVEAGDVVVYNARQG